MVPPEKSMIPIVFIHPLELLIQYVTGEQMISWQEREMRMRQIVLRRPTKGITRITPATPACSISRKKKEGKETVDENLLIDQSEISLRPQQAQSPMKPLAELGYPNANEKPTSAQTRVDVLKMRKVKPMILSRFFLLTSPPWKRPMPGAISTMAVADAITQAMLPLSQVLIEQQSGQFQTTSDQIILQDQSRVSRQVYFHLVQCKLKQYSCWGQQKQQKIGMNSADVKWSDIISSVEKAHLQATKSLKVREKQLNRKYVEEADQQMRRKQEETTQRRCEELEERLIMEEDARKDEETRRITRQMKLQRQRQYSKDNLQLMLSPPERRNSAYPPNSYSEHPFTSLADHADKRRDHFRQKLRRQNQMNHLQEKIKQKERQERLLSEKEYKQKYVSHVQAFYLKKTQDRNAFKDKYLKLSNTEKSQLLPPSSPLHETIEKQYETINGQLMKTSKLKANNVDSVLGRINKHIDVPDSSPAFLGRIPVNADRKQQLDYIQRSAYRGSHSDKKRLKTEGDICDSSLIDAKRYGKQTQELPALEKYYKNFSLANQFDSKIQQKSKQDQGNPSPIVNYRKVYEGNLSRNTTNQLRKKEAVTVTLSKHQEIMSGYQGSQNTTAKKVYSTYDIIQNRRKFVCI